MGWLERMLGRGASAAPDALAAADPRARDDRSIRIFISSTFLDMQRERDALVRQTFPALRARFRARGVELREVDLRWGITQEQAESGDILPICLSEIDRCRPFFIGLLGERYGWIPSEADLPDRLRESFPAVAKATGRSVTELEIIHGVLAARQKVEAFFFERTAGGAGDESNDARRKQADLKKRIRASGAPVSAYSSPEDLGAAVEGAVARALDARFPEDETEDPFIQDERLHQAYARERIGLHVGAESYLQALDKWLAEEAAPALLVAGASGGGKSTLIANWLDKVRRSKAPPVIFEHYLGASPDSADPVLLMRRLWEHLNRATEEKVELPTGSPDLMRIADGLAKRLALASAWAERARTGILIALDGLDKLASERNLRWLLLENLPRIKLLASSLDGEASEAARARGWRTLAIAPLKDRERREFVSRTLAAWGKALSPVRAERILAHALAGAPLFLRTMLDELRYSATEARLDALLGLYLAAKDMDDLFGRVLERVEADCGRDFTERALSLIWASRAGLEESELLAITGASPLVWSVARNGLAEALRDQAGRITFSHDFLRVAVGERYLAGADARRAAHLALADHFERRDVDPRQTEELPFQLRAAEAWDRLEALLLDLNRFHRQRRRGEAEVLSYWLPLMQRGRDPGALVAAFEAKVGGVGHWPREALGYADAIHSFLQFAGVRGDAWRRLAEMRASVARGVLGPDHLDALVAKKQLAETLNLRGEYARARALYEEALEDCRRSLGEDHLETQTTKNNLAGVLFNMDDLAGARALYEQALEVRRKVLGVENLDTLATMNNLAQTLSAQGDAEGAIELQEAVHEAAARALGPDDALTLAATLNLGGLYRARGDLERARLFEERALAAMDRVLGAEHPTTLSACAALARTLGELRDYAGAQALQERALDGRRRVLGSEHNSTLTVMSELAMTLYARRDYAVAARHFKEAYETRLRLFGPDYPQSVVDLGNLGDSLFQAGDLRAAEAVQSEVVALATRQFGPDDSETRQAASDLARTRAALGSGPG